MKKNQMNQIECQFCNKVFGNNQLLRQHQKKTKYCLNIQNIFFSENPQMTIKEYEKKADKQNIKCQFCNSIFASIILLDQHQKRAKHCLKIQEIKAKEEADAEERKEAEELILKEKAKELTCQFCSKEFKTKYLLNKHQTQAKYCLLLQESQNSGEIIRSFVTCTFCNKNFSSSTFNRHDSTCKKKNQFLLNQKDQEIAMMKMKAENAEEIAKMKAEIGSIYKESAERAQATIEEIAKQPTYQKNSTRNIQNNLMISNLTPLDLSQARVDSIIDERYTKNDFYEGQKGAAHLVHKYIATDSNGNPQIVCTDTERGIFHHKSAIGDHVVDYKNVHLIKKVHSPLKRKAGAFAAEESVKNPTALKEIINNMTSIKDLETKPCLFNRTLAQLTGKNCAKQIDTECLIDEDI
jgi:hypothetical protein